MNNVITVEEASKIMNKSVRTIQKYCEEGKLKARKTNKSWLIDKDSLKN